MTLIETVEWTLCPPAIPDSFDFATQSSRNDLSVKTLLLSDMTEDQLKELCLAYRDAIYKRAAMGKPVAASKP